MVCRLVPRVADARAKRLVARALRPMDQGGHVAFARWQAASERAVQAHKRVYLAEAPHTLAFIAADGTTIERVEIAGGRGAAIALAASYFDGRYHELHAAGAAGIRVEDRSGTSVWENVLC